MSVHLFGLLGISASGLANDFINAITKWLEAGAAGIVRGVGSALDATTSVTFDGSFLSLYNELRTFGGALALPILLAATIRAIVRSDGAALVRTLIVRAPIALIGSGAAIWLVQEGLAITDAFSSALLANRGGSGARFTDNLVSFLSGGGSALNGFEGVLLALVTAVAAFALWVELIVRSAAVLSATLFLPLALVGVIWPVTDHWIRRLAETIAALVLSKVVMVGVLVLGIVTLGDPSGIAGAVEGIAILLLSTCAPFALFRLLPFIEQGATNSLDGLSHRFNRTMFEAGSDGIRSALGGGGSLDVEPQHDPVPWARSQPVDPAVFSRTYNDVLSELESHTAGRDNEEDS